MAKRDKYHHLAKKGATWHFRKGRTRFSLETTDAADPMRKRDRLLENLRLYGSFTITEPEDEGPKFGEVVKEWAEIHSKKLKYSTWRDYRSCMNTHLLPAFKDMPINAITFQDVERFRAGLECGSKRINNILVPMRSVYDYAFKAGYVSDNVMLNCARFQLKESKAPLLIRLSITRLLTARESTYSQNWWRFRNRPFSWRNWSMERIAPRRRYGSQAVRTGCCPRRNGNSGRSH